MMYLYRFFDADDQLLYVGITSNLEARFRGHSLSQPWWPQVALRTIETVNDDEARFLERKAIYDEQPLFNKIGARRTYEAQDDPLDSWGDNIAAARAAAYLTQSQLARILGVTLVTIQRWEAYPRLGYGRQPRGEDLCRLSDALGVPVTTLFPRTEREVVLEQLAENAERVMAQFVEAAPR